MGPRRKVCCMCHGRLAPDDPGYAPPDYPELMCCAGCAHHFRRWEAWERGRKGKIMLRTINMVEPYFDFRKKFYDAKWTKEKIIAEIKAAEKEGRIHRCYIENKPLVRAAERRFGGWKRALRAARARSYGNDSPKSTPSFDV